MGYRVREELANIGATEAVGRTADVSGSLTIEGTTISKVEITADETTATGDLTLHGVTKSVQVPLQARFEGTTIVVAGSLRIAFADFGIVKPQAMVVLSVEDTAVMELIHFTRCCG